MLMLQLVRGNILIMPEEEVGPIKRGFGLLGLRTPKVRSTVFCLFGSCRMFVQPTRIYFPGAVLSVFCVKIATVL